MITDFSSIYVVIPFYNGDAFIVACLDSLRQMDGFRNGKVVIVDNSNEETEINSIAKRYEFVHLIQTAPSLGFAKANNLGAQYALKEGAEFIVLLNQDTILQPNFFGEIVKPFYDDESIAIVAPMLY